MITIITVNYDSTVVKKSRQNVRIFLLRSEAKTRRRLGSAISDCRAIGSAGRRKRTTE